MTSSPSNPPLSHHLGAVSTGSFQRMLDPDYPQLALLQGNHLHVTLLSLPCPGLSLRATTHLSRPQIGVHPRHHGQAEVVWGRVGRHMTELVVNCLLPG